MKLQIIKSFGKCEITFSIKAYVLINVKKIYLEKLLLDSLFKLYDELYLIRVEDKQEYYFKLATI